MPSASTRSSIPCLTDLERQDGSCPSCPSRPSSPSCPAEVVTLLGTALTRACSVCDVDRRLLLSVPFEICGQSQKILVVVPITSSRPDTGIPLAIQSVPPQLKPDEIMLLNLFYCYLSGHHDFGVRCDPGEIYLRCIHCGRRSAGWAISGAKQSRQATADADAKRQAETSKRATGSSAPAVASA